MEAKTNNFFIAGHQCGDNCFFFFLQRTWNIIWSLMKSLTLILAAIFQSLQALTTWQTRSWRLGILRIWNLCVQLSKRSTRQSRNESRKDKRKFITDTAISYLRTELWKPIFTMNFWLYTIGTAFRFVTCDIKYPHSYHLPTLVN